MKKLLMTSMAVLGVATTVFSSVSYAKETELTLSFPEISLQVSIPQKYEYVIDGKQSYRENIDELQIDGFGTDDVISMINSSDDSFFEALYVDGDYFVESYIYYLDNEDEEIGQLKDYSEEEIDDFGAELESTMEDVDDYGDISATYEGVYYNSKNEPYIMLEMVSENKNDEFINACLCTVVNNDFYYFYTKSYDPDADIDDLFENTKSLADGASFSYDSSIKSTAKLKSGIDWSHVFSKAAVGACVGAVIGGVGSVINKKKKNKDVENQ